MKATGMEAHEALNGLAEAIEVVGDWIAEYETSPQVEGLITVILARYDTLAVEMERLELVEVVT